MTGLRCGLLVLLCAVCVFAIPSSLLTDVKQAEMSHARITNKVKRAQEVIMFGNQQNRGGDSRNSYALPRAEKRGVDLESNVLADSPTEQPPDMEDTIDESEGMPTYYKNYNLGRGDPEYAQRLQNSVLKSEYYTDPATLTDLKYFDLDERRKREAFRTPSKRNSRGLTTGRTKRDLDELDPEELLALLSYYGRRNKIQQNRNMYNQYNPMDSDDMEMLDNQEGGNDIAEEEEPRPIADGWMDGPVALPSRHFSSPVEPWGRQRFSEDRRKRFMVSKRNAQEGDIYSLAQMMNGPQRSMLDSHVHRRYIL